jgi:5'(3')-deoxyribonucleotidase
MSNIIIGVDVDDVLLKLVKKWLQVHNIKNNDDISEKDITSWDIASHTNLKNKPQDFYDLLTPDVYDDIEIVDNALRGVNFLRQFSRVIFITSNFGNIGAAKFEALNRNGFDVSKKDFFEAYDKSLIKCDVLFDDNYENVTNAFSKGVLFTQPWNKMNTYSPRCNDWVEIMRWSQKEFKL